MGTALRTTSPTIRDVARLAGVSPQTVSRVLNTPDKVKEATRTRVLDSIDRLGYRRSPLAWGLATARSGAIGIIDSGSGAIGQGLLVTGIELAARERGLSPRTAYFGSFGPGAVNRAHELLRDEMVEGFIILGNTTLEVREALTVSAGFPTVLAASNEDAFGHVSTVAADQQSGSIQMMERLRTYGPRVGIIRGPEGWLDADARYRAWQQSTPQPDPCLVRDGDWTSKSGYDAMIELLEVGVDAVFACNDLMALGATWACVSHGLKVPEDVAIGGFDDIQGADFANPPLTTVRQPFNELGRTAVMLLDELIRGESSRSVTLPTELVVRNTA